MQIQQISMINVVTLLVNHTRDLGSINTTGDSLLSNACAVKLTEPHSFLSHQQQQQHLPH